MKDFVEESKVNSFIFLFQAPKKQEPTKIPSPKPLADIFDKTRPNTKIPTPRRRNSKGTDSEDGEYFFKENCNR